ncbi:MAG TPA: hypothetical protein PLA12_01035 [Candidatus Hydrogenedens sp.]|nr:hypothetical protein [Candidatus Hydrogenedens sp.]
MPKKNIYSIIFLLIFFLEVSSFAEKEHWVDIQQKDKNILAKQRFEILVNIKAEKEENPYCFFPPEFENDKENLSLNVKKMGTRESEREVNLEICIEGIAQEAGEYTVGPMRIPYIVLSSDMETEFIKDNTRVIPTSYWEVPSLQIKVRDERFFKYKRYAYIGVGIILFSVSSIFMVLFYRNRMKNQPIKAEITMSDSLHVARKYRLDGNYYEYLKTLLEIVKRLQEKKGDKELLNLEQKLKEKINEVGYKGITPTEQEMDFFWKEVANNVSIYEDKKNV